MNKKEFKTICKSGKVKIKSDKDRIYLGGYAEEVEYREKCIELYGHIEEIELFDPIQVLRNIPIIWEKNRHMVPDIDKEIIRNCKCVVVYIKQASFGSAMEILWAWIHNIPVYVINPDESWYNDMWLKEHTTKFFNSIEGCFDFILEQYTNKDKNECYYCMEGVCNGANNKG